MRESLRIFVPLLRFLRPELGRLAGLVLASGIGAATVALQPWPLKLVIDHALLGRAAPHWLQQLGVSADPRLGILYVSVVALLMLYVVTAGCEAIATLGWTVLGRRITYRLGETLLVRVQQRSLREHLTLGVGETLARVADDAWIAYRAFDELLFKPLRAGLIMLVMVALMWTLDWQLALLVLFLAPLILRASTIAGQRLRQAAELARQTDGRIRGHVQQAIAGIAVVQSFGREEDVASGLDVLAADAVAAQQRIALLKGAGNLVTGLAAAAGTALVLWLSADRVLAGTLSLGSMLVLVGYLRTAQTQMGVLGRVYGSARTLAATADRVHDTLHAEPEVRDVPGARVLPAGAGRVEFEDVSFAYDPAMPVLEGITLTAEPGETIALVGATGAGKSTLVGLIPRFFDPTAGRVLIGGHDVRQVQLASLRRQVSLVLQEPFLFPVSIAQNIAYGRPDATSGEIEQAARAACIHDFVTRLPQGYDTRVGERGATLSGGERQRISIARALLKDAPILILDEPTAALDAQTEALIMQAMDTLVAGRTTFVIAHRLSTVRNASRIAVLEGGRIRETGTHEELTRQDGLYAKLTSLQLDAKAGA